MRNILKFLCMPILFATVLHAQGRWVWQNPLPQGNRLKAIQVFANGEILAAGANGTLVRSANNGLDWQVRHYAFGTDYHEIDDMQFVDDNTGWAVESEYSGWSDIYYTSDRGATWARRTRTPFGINGFFARDGQHAWGAGIAHAMTRTTDGGLTWSKHDVDSAGTFIGGGIFFLDQNRGWIVGGSGILGGSVYGRIFHTLDGGITWSELFTNPVRNTALGEVFFIDENTGWVGGTDGLIMGTVDGGRTWTTQYHRPRTNFAILDIFFHDQNNGIAVGTDGLVVTTDNGGQTWEERDSTTEAWIRDIFPVNNSTIWGCGEFGLLIRSDDGGQTWSQVGNGINSALLTCVAFRDEMTGWVGGGPDGQLFKTEDGGKNWFVARSGESPVTVLQFLDQNNGFRIEWYGQTYRTRDGGNTWELTESLAHDGLYLNGCFADTSHGWLTWNYLRDGYIKKTSDGGKSWMEQLRTPDDSMYGIDFVDANTGWVAGESGNIFKTTDGGESWQRQESGTSQTLYQIDFVNENTGWIVGPWGTMLATTDGGETWNKVDIPFTATLNDVFFLDENTGWICGNGGVGRTFDAGRTWETFAMPQGPDYLHQALYFTSADNGWLVGATGHILKFDGNVTSIVEDETPMQIPTTMTLYQNYPNPFCSGATSRLAGNPSTVISYRLAVNSEVSLELYNLSGQRVRTLVSGTRPAGRHQVVWDGRDGAGRAVASGKYFYRLSAGPQHATRGMILIK